MMRREFDELMRLLCDIYGGGYGGAGAETWFKMLEKYDALRVREAIWFLGETQNTKPKIADIIGIIKAGTIVGGGSAKVETNGCSFCAGSGWASVEVSPGQVVMMRCLCDRGQQLNARCASLSEDMLRTRYVSLNGTLKIRNPAEEQREAKIMEMDTEQTIKWCKRGMAILAGRIIPGGKRRPSGADCDVNDDAV